MFRVLGLDYLALRYSGGFPQSRKAAKKDAKKMATRFGESFRADESAWASFELALRFLDVVTMYSQPAFAKIDFIAKLAFTAETPRRRAEREEFLYLCVSASRRELPVPRGHGLI